MKTEPTEAFRAMANNLKYNVGVIHSNPQLILEESFISGVRYGQSSPKIKQLEWRYDEEFFIWEANSVFGKYFVKAGKNEGALTVDANKSAAQRDFEQRIKECLE